MTTDDYKKARAKLGVSVAEWTKQLGISINTHDSYTCGRLAIPQRTENHIYLWLIYNDSVGE